MRNTYVLLLSLSLVCAQLAGQTPVTIEEKPLIIPTYRVAPPDKYPIFYTGRIYQGAQGFVYPYPLYDVLTDDRNDQSYQAVYLDNEYLELCVVPELGGRLFSARDKTNQYEIFYKQHVIKPSLIGMIGAWISGGIEWNIPDHHRATSHLPVDYTMVSNPDGSKTVWVGETELSRGLRWTVGLSIYPGKSYIEATVKIFNPTPFVHSFLYWANVSVHCDDNYQVIFPPNTQYGAQHAKSEFVNWPIGQGRYAGLDRTGVDLSWWKNHPNPASVFAWNFTDDFLAGYDFGKDAGTVHVANHHIVTGKKFFLWGNNEEAEMWEKMLTETDGQYLELMVGAYSDNQPDYSWIGPGETKIFKQYWYPVQKIGGVKNANTEAALNVDRSKDGLLKIGVQPTSLLKNVRLVARAGNKILLETRIDIDPSKPFIKELDTDPGIADTNIKVSLFHADGKELISYQSVVPEKEEMPEPVERPRKPEEYTTVEELYLTGMRIEQFKNAVIDPLPYYIEALKRDSMDSRVNTALGIRYCKEGKFQEAEKHLRRAVKRITKNYTRPRTGESLYYLGVVLQHQNKLNDAEDVFWRASWDAGFQAPAYYNLAEIACRKGDFENALLMVEKSIELNQINSGAFALKAYILRKTAEYEKAGELLELTKNLDILDHWANSESSFLKTSLSGQKTWSDEMKLEFKKRMGSNVQYLLELAMKYINIGAWDEALYVLDQFRTQSGSQNDYPLLAYYSGYCHLNSGDSAVAMQQFRLASSNPVDYCFPSRLKEIEILQTALNLNPSDARGWYYLGNLLYYLNQNDKAISQWEKSVQIDNNLGYAWRNLGFAYRHHSPDLNRSIDSYKKAFALNNTDPRLLSELDETCEKAGVSPSERLAFMWKHVKIAEKHDDALKRLIELKMISGDYEWPMKIMTNHHFHVWEGGSSVHDYFEDANLIKGINLMDRKNYSRALQCFELAETYPDNHEEGKSVLSRAHVRTDFYKALAWSGLGNDEKARELFVKSSETEGPQFYPEIAFYRALALKRSGKDTEGDKVLEELRKYAANQLNLKPETDFFSKFNDDSKEEVRQARNYYLLGLVCLGKGDKSGAYENFSKSEELDPNQIWPGIMKKMKIKLL